MQSCVKLFKKIISDPNVKLEKSGTIGYWWDGKLIISFIVYKYTNYKIYSRQTFENNNA